MNKLKTVAIIQARMNSTRLPGKAILPLARNPALQQMIERVQKAQGVDQIIVATPYDESNKPIWDLCNDMKIIPWTGSEHDVLYRVLTAAWGNRADIIIDLTGDCPLIDHRHITRLVKTVKNGFKPWRRTIDYTSNISPRSWPDGFDVQVYRTKALEKVRLEFNPPHHVGWNIAQLPEVFRIAKNLTAPALMHWPGLRLTLDTKEDYEVLQKVFEYFGDKDFTVEETIRLMVGRPEWQKINRKVRTKSPEEG